jgi:hypothetical protein
MPRPRDLDGFVFALDRAVAPRQNRHAGFAHHAASPRLVGHQPDDLGIRPDELDVAGGAHLRQVGALGQEPVAGMNRVGAGDLRRADHRRHVQITVRASRRSDADVLVRKFDVERVLVGLGVHGDRLDAELAARIDDPQGDFATIGDENFLKHIACSAGLQACPPRRT